METSGDVNWIAVGAIAQSVSVLGIFSAIVALFLIKSQIKLIQEQILLMKKQIDAYGIQLKDTRQWNKLNFTYTFFPQPIELEELENHIDKITWLWKRDDAFDQKEIKALLGNPLSLTEIKILMEKFHAAEGESEVSSEVRDKFIESWRDAGRKLKLYLNLIETYCTAINTGVAESDTAKRIFGTKFKHHHRKLVPYIAEVKQKYGEEVFIEFLTVIKKWYPDTGKTPSTHYPCEPPGTA